MKLKIKYKNLIILFLIILLFLLAVGYSVFSDILTIQGTASAKGTFNLEFQNAEVVKNVGANKENTTAIISPDKDTLIVNVADLSYPGAGVEFSVDIVNAGVMPAEIQAVLPTNITGSDKIKVEGLEEIEIGHPRLEVGDICNVHFTVQWPVEAGEILESESNISFGLQIEYTEKVIPEYTVPIGLTAEYGDTLADIKLPEGFRFQDSLETLVGNVGTNSFKATYTSDRGIEVTDIDIEIEVGKANPTYIEPTGLTAGYGQTLANVKLPEGFKFQDSLETSVGNVGTNKFKVTYTPKDTNNYNILTDIEVEIEVTYQTLVSQITPEDYGKSINYSVTVQNQELNNWKVLYNDKNNIYVILDDFLPVDLVPYEAGLDVDTTYGGVYSTTSREVLLNGLRAENCWKEFASGVEGATATGGPTFEIITKSYNEKYNKTINTNPSVAGRFVLENTDPLYIVDSEKLGDTYGYWLLAEAPGNSDCVWRLSRNRVITVVEYNCNSADGNVNFGVRPVICLPSTTLGSINETVKIELNSTPTKVQYETLVSQVKASDYGKRINYEVTVKGQKLDEWRVLYNDKNNIYLILRRYLPNNLVPTQAGLNTSKTYNVYSNTSRTVLLNGLRTKNYWQEFANGIEGATATGGPELSILINSYNEKYNHNININELTTSTTISDIDVLYMPSRDETESVNFYWFVNELQDNTVENFENRIWTLQYNGYIFNHKIYSNVNGGIRPVVVLPTTAVGNVGERIAIK